MVTVASVAEIVLPVAMAASAAPAVAVVIVDRVRRVDPVVSAALVPEAIADRDPVVIVAHVRRVAPVVARLESLGIRRELPVATAPAVALAVRTSVRSR